MCVCVCEQQSDHRESQRSTERHAEMVSLSPVWGGADRPEGTRLYVATQQQMILDVLTQFPCLVLLFPWIQGHIAYLSECFLSPEFKEYAVCVLWNHNGNLRDML